MDCCFLNSTGDQFLEFYEKVKKEAELIKKQKRLNEIDHLLNYLLILQVFFPSIIYLSLY
ncbi:hypothetical protein [Spiroplasma endosymbiont of Polydrusus pterygomalis]|uniref:hypothetical protein n=1 Tax=Spiroplasma endosymbiont of Polydrusus pterygomalis TaxID=3139327 RepID=UPI003CCB1B7B